MNVTETRIIILAPSGNDAANVSRILRDTGFEPVTCSSLSELCALYREGAGALLIAQEGLTRDGVVELALALNDQEPWSDIPVILVTHGANASLPEIDHVFGSRVNLSLIERPLSPSTLISSIRASQRARNRQYELRTLLNDLDIAREDAVVANRMKDDFLATVSHELRNPLNGILGFSQLLRRPNRSPKDVEHGLNVIERNARIQAALIDDLLDISRIVSGNLRLDMQLVELGPILTNAIESVRPLAEAKDVAIIVQCDEASFHLMGDVSRLQQIIWNLLTNAIKFSRKGGKIAATLTAAGKQALISVTDNGIGIAPEFLPYVFDRFRQQDQAITRKKMGLGLGLSIVRHLVEMHSGTIEASSDGEGRGATFTLRLPLADRCKIESEIKNPAIEVPAYEVLEHLIPTLQGIRILAVDDDEDSRSLIKAVLEESGAEVVTASSAGEAMVLLEEFRPHVLLSDIGMPNEDGYSLIQKIRALSNSNLRLIPAIALTAFSRPIDKFKAMDAGFQAHITKPVAAIELAKLASALAKGPVGGGPSPAQSGFSR